MNGIEYCVGQELATSGGLNVRSSGSIAADIVAVLQCGATVPPQGLPQSSGTDGQQATLTEYFAGDYTGEDAPMSLGYYALTTLTECFEE